MRIDDGADGKSGLEPCVLRKPACFQKSSLFEDRDLSKEKKRPECGAARGHPGACGRGGRRRSLLRR
ncbi:hypothetical protein VARIO8X_60485 [Burkholderiales bacterium 8X]|nr:hypothetical protein VARIO8X_60485 [Burkholderiales bacterium 8X]